MCQIKLNKDPSAVAASMKPDDVTSARIVESIGEHAQCSTENLIKSSSAGQK
jgi:hypothetical protein